MSGNKISKWTVYVAALLLSIFVIQSTARVVIDPGVDEQGNGLYGGMVQGRLLTALLTITRTVSSATTTTLSTGKVCMRLSTSGTLTPSTLCARKRRNWNGRREEEPMLYVLYDENGEDFQFVRPERIHPAKVQGVETTASPGFRDGVSEDGQDVASAPLVEGSLVESATETDLESPGNIRVAQPIYFAALASILSNVFPSVRESTTTQTSTSTSYLGGTSTVTVFTSVTAFTLIGSCFPIYPPLC